MLLSEAGLHRLGREWLILRANPQERSRTASPMQGRNSHDFSLSYACTEQGLEFQGVVVPF